jgi:hypothetical protein
MSDTESAVIVEDLFLTDTFLIKGRLPNKSMRLVKMLEDFSHGFLQIEDAVMVSLRSSEVIRTPRVLVNPNELILAHELVDVAGDSTLRQLADNQKAVRIRAFYKGVVQLELSGNVEAQAYEPHHLSGRQYFTMEDPVLRGLRFEDNSELAILKNLGYAIVRKDRLAYVYDFS